MSVQDSYYWCGKHTMDYTLVKDAINKYCLIYQEQVTFHAFNFDSREEQKLDGGNKILHNDNAKYVIQPIYDINLRKKIGSVTIRISTDKCTILNVKYKLGNKLIHCELVTILNSSIKQNHIDKPTKFWFRKI
ncbi:hypothetical protein OnM2_015069 [Erysiphe neolycopersici]|uniref:Uncharacterized protein n=1 Tax=Erysiphe neolycopersici TaxID=212602 RepID=A0A420I5I7_9PEZI|nr:hypothetical protein OnM2_015069 [Erysiphe neolycopersici]